MVSAAEWFKKFVEELPNDDGVRIQREFFNEQGNWGTDTQWTHVMAVFLTKLAKKMGYLQDSEVKIDFVWYRGDSKNPSILIEHENDYEGVNESELLRLLHLYKHKKCELRILITYTWPKKRAKKRTSVEEITADEIKQIRNKILENISTKIRELRKTWSGEFLLIIGDARPDEGDIDWDTYWHGYILDQSGHCEVLS